VLTISSTDRNQSDIDQDRDGNNTAHVEVFEERRTICVRETFRSGNPEVWQESLDVEEYRVTSLEPKRE
jgi:hypothetical protein